MKELWVFSACSGIMETHLGGKYHKGMDTQLKKYQLQTQDVVLYQVSMISCPLVV